MNCTEARWQLFFLFFFLQFFEMLLSQDFKLIIIYLEKMSFVILR